MKNNWFILVAAAILMASCGGERTYYAEIQTDFGNMKVELYNSTPVHRDNFIKLVNEGFYNDLLFHRVIAGFMVQGGDPESKAAAPNTPLGMGGPGYTLPNEIGAPHFKGTLAAARLGGPSNPAKRSSGSQFYIVQGQIQNEPSLQAMAKSKGFQYNEAQIEKYMKMGGTPGLDGDYTVFGEVVDGLEVVDKIAAVATNSANRPLQDVVMKIRMVQ